MAVGLLFSFRGIRLSCSAFKTLRWMGQASLHKGRLG